VPQIDTDGLEVTGIRTPDVDLPLATYTGWNLRPKGSAERDQAGIMGSAFPFARTEAERQALGDPRASIAQRYASRAQYVRSVVLAAQKLIEQRLLLDEDAERYVEAALNTSVFESGNDGLFGAD
ncbi:MAG: alpha/beta hydrolase domain-containing protein, partial [bacterium]|nr:alpha/beta hydrolase domain-containing protein [bacterium]